MASELKVIIGDNTLAQYAVLVSYDFKDTSPISNSTGLS